MILVRKPQEPAVADITVQQVVNQTRKIERRQYDQQDYGWSLICTIPAARDEASWLLLKRLVFLDYLIRPVRRAAVYGLRPSKRGLQSFGGLLGK